MVIEKVVTIVAVIVLNFFLVHKFVKRYVPENLFIEAVASFAFGSYLVFTINNVYIPEFIQVLLFVSMFLMPLTFVLLQYNNIILTKKILYYKMKWNMYLQDYEKSKDLLYKLIEQTGRKAEF